MLKQAQEAKKLRNEQKRKKENEVEEDFPASLYEINFRRILSFCLSSLQVLFSDSIPPIN